MANASYRTEATSMAHCPMWWNSGQYSRVPGDSVLGLYGADYERFKQGSFACQSPPCDYCEKNKLANLYKGPYRVPLMQPTYGTRYVGTDFIYRDNVYDKMVQNPCETLRHE